MESDRAGAVPEAVPARMVNEVLYCPRLMYLEWVQGEFRDNHFTVEGRVVHKRADHKGGKLPEPGGAPDGAGDDDSDAEDSEHQGGDPKPTVARSVWLTSERLGVTAKIDIVEGTSDGVVVPVEYKRGGVPAVPGGAYLPERGQLCVQVLLLREHGYACNEAWIYYAADRRRVAIAMDDELIAATHAAIADARRIAAQTTPPPPLDNSPKCRGCSLAGICLPDEVIYLQRGEPGGEPEVRRLHPSRDDALPVYVQEHGAYVGVSGGCLRVTRRGGEVTEAQLPHTSHVSIFGYTQISTQALHALSRQGIPVSFFTSGGWLIGQFGGMPSKNVELRVSQYRVADDAGACLGLARRMVVAKILNCRTMLRRNGEGVAEQDLRALAEQAERAGEASSLEVLLGMEGTAARVYFRAFSTMLKSEGARRLAESFERRNRRPPRDPINALLSFAYSMLTRDLVATLTAVGLDPMRGFYHQLRFGRPALALDMMEEFRPLIADSVVVTALNTGVVGEGDFEVSPVAVNLSSAGRKRFLRAYERRMDHLVTHPVFGYRIGYRRILEVQARLLGRHLLGELAEYPQFRTR